jgi:hypothetical protein
VCTGVPAHFRASSQIKRSVRFGTEDMVSNPVRPIRTVHWVILAGRPADSPCGSRSLSQYTLDFEEMKQTVPSNTEFKLRWGTRLGPCRRIFPLRPAPPRPAPTRPAPAGSPPLRGTHMSTSSSWDAM